MAAPPAPSSAWTSVSRLALSLASPLASAALMRSLYITDLYHGPAQTMLSFWQCVFGSELTGHITVATLAALVAAVAKLRNEPTPLSIATATFLVASLVPLRRLLLRLLHARGDFSDALQRAGIPSHYTESGSLVSIPRLLAMCLPSPWWISRGVHVLRAIAYDVVPKRERDLDDGKATLGPGERNATGVLNHPQPHAIPIPGGWKALKLDLYWNPRTLRRPAPIFLYVHGGAWVTGHRSVASIPLLVQLANAGFLVASINYRLAPAVTWTHMLRDCNAAVAWLRAHGAAFGGDPAFIAAAGESAGGHLALMLGLAPRSRSFLREAGGPGSDVGPPPAAVGVDAVVDLYGVTDWTDSQLQYANRTPQKGALHGIFALLAKRVIQRGLDEAPLEYVRGSPLMWMLGQGVRGVLRRSRHASIAALADVGAGVVAEMEAEEGRHDVPPLLIVHGDADTLVPVQDSRELWGALQQRRGREVARRAAAAGATDAPQSQRSLDLYIELPGVHHAFNYVPSSRTLALGDAVADWLEHVYASVMAARRLRGAGEKGPAGGAPAVAAGESGAMARL